MSEMIVVEILLFNLITGYIHAFELTKIKSFYNKVK